MPLREASGSLSIDLNLDHEPRELLSSARSHETPLSSLTAAPVTNCLEPAGTIPESYSTNPPNHYVYDPHRGPVATIRANMFKAEGPGKNTGLITDEIGPRRITPTECARVHGFDTKPIQHLTPHQIYSLIGNSVTFYSLV